MRPAVLDSPPSDAMTADQFAEATNRSVATAERTLKDEIQAGRVKIVRVRNANGRACNYYLPA
jgi:predicted transcriptional regulator